LIITCCNKLFSLSLPDLSINWAIKPDWATCFSIYFYLDTYIIHGELEVSRINREGEILWSFGGMDIFVCLYEGIPFAMHDNFIDLTDFNGFRYRIDYDGNLIEHPEPIDTMKNSNFIPIPPKKAWWKFW
jgi:hypothetical protein